MQKNALLILIICAFCCCDRTDIVVQNSGAQANAVVYLNLDSLRPTSIKNDTIGDNEILLKGKVVDLNHNNVTVSGARIKVAGSDTPGNSAFSTSDGDYQILLPIVIDANKKSMILVFEVQKDGAEQKAISELLNSEQIKTLGISNPEQHMVAYAGVMNVGWNRCGCTLQCDIPIKMKE